MAEQLVALSKEFSWEMGHRLPNHAGGCQNVHGHSYRLIVEVLGVPRGDGMVMDYAEMSAAVRPLVDRLDHCFLCDSQDAAMLTFLCENNLKVEVLAAPTTAENIALWLLEQITPTIAAHPNVHRIDVRLWETAKNGCIVSHITPAGLRRL